MRQAQNIKNILGGLPLLADPPGLGAVLQAGGESGPLYPNVLDKFGVELPDFAAALAPVKHKFRNGLLDKVARNAAALHDFQRIGTGLPIVVQCLHLGNVEGLGGILLVAAPVADDVLAEFVFPGVAGLAALAPVKDEVLQLLQRKLARYVVVQAQQLQQVLTG